MRRLVDRPPVLLPPAPSFADDCRRAEADLAGRLPDLLAHWTKKLTPLPPPVELAWREAAAGRSDLPRRHRAARPDAGDGRRRRRSGPPGRGNAVRRPPGRVPGGHPPADRAGRFRRRRPGRLPHPAGSDEVVGPLVNTIVLRADLTGEPTFADLLARTRRTRPRRPGPPGICRSTCSSASCGRGGTVRHQPLLQVLFNYSPGPPMPAVPGATWTAEAVPNGTSKFDLSLVLDDGPGGLLGQIEYSTDLFDAAAVENFAGHFRTLLAAALADPGARVSRLPLLVRRRMAAVFDEWNATAVDHPTDPAHTLIAARATATPTTSPSGTAGEVLTYAELDRQANRLAHHLRALGVGPDVPVGVGLERSADWIVAALAVWKAGGAYLPLDPRYPAERLALVLRDARAPVLITRSDVADKLPASGGTIVRLDADAAAIAGQPDTDPAVAVTPDNLAYIIYTSGSTGTPKGVMVRHGGFCRTPRIPKSSSLECLPHQSAGQSRRAGQQSKN